MGSGGDNELPSDRVTLNVRIYRGDKQILERMAREQTAAQRTGRRITPADVVRRLLAEQAKERGQ